MTRRGPDDDTVERGAQVLLALQRYKRGDGDHAELLALLVRPEVLAQVARSGAAIRGAFSWLVALVEAELPPSLRRKDRGGK